MSEMEMKDDVETEEFIDELSDDALDREQGGDAGRSSGPLYFSWGAHKCFISDR